MTCALCSGIALPHHAAHERCGGCGTELAVCFGCGGGSVRPSWETWREKREPGAPVYSRLGELRRKHVETCSALPQAPSPDDLDQPPATCRRDP